MPRGGRKPWPFQKLVESFWKRANCKSENECWMMRGKLYTDAGYPMGPYNISAHRFAYMLLKGPIPEGLQVLHECDNRNCVNPNHLVVGSQSKNLMDCAMRKRLPRARFTSEDVRAMRQLWEDGISQSEIARRYKTASPVIHNIVHRKRWRFI